MKFWQGLGNIFKNIFVGLWKCIKWLFFIIAAFFCWLVKTTIGKVITGTLAAIIIVILIYLFVKYALPTMFRSVYV